MCGIYGKYSFEKSDRVAEKLLKSMGNVVYHRGPDEEGLFLEDNFGFGIQRLKVIDLETGSQPIHNENFKIWVLLNGEIYNFRELRRGLEDKGHQFYTKSDAEVLVHLYEEVGSEFVERLNGMFAIALWDSQEERLILVRDRLGQKPLYYYLTEGSLLFASELKSILEDRSVERKLNLEAIHHYFTYSRVPGPFCIIDGVKKLPPAHRLICENGETKVERYWKLTFKEKIDLPRREIQKGILEHLERSVQLRMISDVPLGAFLSGGTDSSAVVAMMARLSKLPVKTFSIGFAESDFCELEYARKVAQSYHTDHYELIIEPEGFLEHLPKIVWHLDEPLADPGTEILTYLISRFSRQHVTVALSGDGGDELFAGYDKYPLLKIVDRYYRMPLIRGFLGMVARSMPEMHSKNRFIKAYGKVKLLVERQSRDNLDIVDLFQNLFLGSTEQGLQNGLYSPWLVKQLGDINSRNLRRDILYDYDGDDSIEGITYTQLVGLLPDLFFARLDRMSMACSLECRSPFADHEFVEFVAQIPFGLKLHGFKTKYILKQALKELVPVEILSRRKMGFTSPLRRWMEKPEFKRYVMNVLGDRRSVERGYFNKGYIEALLDDYISGKKGDVGLIWKLLVFELWSRAYLDDDALDLRKQ